MEVSTLQVQFFEHIIKLRGGNKQKIAKEIAELLSISGNVVYDRLNGKKLLNIAELYILSNHYKTSINDMISPTSSGYNLYSIQKQPESFDDYLNSILVDLEQLADLKDCKILYIASETPFFYYLFHPSIALFKMFLWGKTVWNIPACERGKFDSQRLNSPETQRLMSRLLELYIEFPTVEFWNINMIDTTINQIRHCIDCNLFDNIEEAFILIADIEKIIDKMERMASQGSKEGHGSSEAYHNELIQNSTTILVDSKAIKGIYLIYDSPNFMISYKPETYEHTFAYYEKIKKSSFALTDERQCTRFFRALRSKVSAAKAEFQKGLVLTGDY